MKKAVWAITSVLIFSGILAGFATAAEPIKIAAIFAKTGVAAEMDVVYFPAVDFAVAELNHRGGLLRRLVEVVEIDDQSTPLGAKEAAEQAVKLNVTAVIGASWSSHSMALAPVLQNAGIPMISPVSTSPKVTLLGDYIFRTCATDPFQGKIMAQFARQTLRAKTAVILTNVSSDYSMGLSEFFNKAALQSGLKVLWQGQYKEKDTDFSQSLAKVKTLGPDVFFIPGYDMESALIMKQSRAQGVKSIFLGGDGWNADTMYQYAGQAVEGAYHSDHWHPDVNIPKSKQLQVDFQRKYGDKYGKSMRSDIPSTYDAVMVLAEAIKRAGSLDRAKIRDALAATKNFQGTTGIITFDENRDPLNKEMVVLQYKNGKQLFIKKVKP